MWYKTFTCGGDLGSMRGDRGHEERRMQEWILAEG